MITLKQQLVFAWNFTLIQVQPEDVTVTEIMEPTTSDPRSVFDGPALEREDEPNRTTGINLVL